MAIQINIKYNDTVITAEAGKTVTIKCKDKKLDYDLIISCIEEESFTEETNETGTTVVINSYTEETNDYGTTVII